MGMPQALFPSLLVPRSSSLFLRPSRPRPDRAIVAVPEPAGWLQALLNSRSYEH